MKPMRKIALEEHFTAPGFQTHAAGYMRHIEPRVFADLAARLADFDAQRLGEMDRAGIDFAILSQTGPGVQAETDVAAAISHAAANNDFLASRVALHPKRYAGFATLPLQDPLAAADELERAVTQLGFKGSLVNGHTQGHYYDERTYDPFWDRMQSLDVPMYLHPATSFVVPQAYDAHPELVGATWGWGVETATHALRLIFGGVFDRFPRLKVILGHMGEGLPTQRWRIDSRFAVYSHGIKLRQPPSHYLGSNIVITTSGVCSPAVLSCAIAELGAHAVMFSVDYPYESSAIAAEFIDQAPLDEAVRRQVCSDNAERILKL